MVGHRRPAHWPLLLFAGSLIALWRVSPTAIQANVLSTYESLNQYAFVVLTICSIVPKPSLLIPP